jgi:hypothetical protein
MTVRASGKDVLQAVLQTDSVIADGESVHDTVQGAVDNATDWVFIPPATFNESITVNTQDLSMFGSGIGTVLDGGGDNALDIQSQGLYVSNMSITSSPTTISTNAPEYTVKNCHLSASTGGGGNNIISPGSNDSVVVGCIFKECGGWASRPSTRGIQYKSIFMDGVNRYGLLQDGDDVLTSSNVFNGVGDAGDPTIRLNRNDSICISNRILNAGSYGIRVNNSPTPVDNIVANNRVSDSSNPDIDDVGTGTILDSNRTGAAN